jgi:hypothetical protein
VTDRYKHSGLLHSEINTGVKSFIEQVFHFPGLGDLRIFIKQNEKGEK